MYTRHALQKEKHRSYSVEDDMEWRDTNTFKSFSSCAFLELFVYVSLACSLISMIGLLFRKAPIPSKGHTNI